MKRGEIVLAKFPFTDLSSEKRRPGIVLSRCQSEDNDVIIAFISSVVPILPIKTDYVVTMRHKDFPISGLKKDSVIKLHKLATINQSIITGTIGYLGNDTMLEINECIKYALGL